METESARSALFTHTPHPHIARRRQHAPKAAAASVGLAQRFNKALGVKIT